MLEIYGRVDILINNAGLGARSKVIDMELSTYKKIMDINYFGQIAVTKGDAEFNIVISWNMWSLFESRVFAFEFLSLAIFNYQLVSGIGLTNPIFCNELKITIYEYLHWHFRMKSLFLAIAYVQRLKSKGKEFPVAFLQAFIQKNI